MSRAACLVPVLFTACIESPEISVDDPDTSVASQTVVPADCDPLICAGNSDILGALGPYELSTNPAQVSPRGFKLLSIKKGAVELDSFTVAGATLTGSLPNPDPLAPSIPLGGPPDLVGLKFRLLHSSGQIIELVLNAYQHVPFYDPSKTPRIVGFMITYQRIAPIRGERKDLCPYKDELGGNTAQTWAVFWKGDRYDPETGEIFASGLGPEALGNVGDWFNISCAGEASIKMLRDEIGNAVTPGSPPDLSQATLNMFTAKYCEGPKRYTELGRRLSWDDKWTNLDLGLIKSHEAIWTPTGAACLDRPRMVKREDVECELPACDDMIDDDWKNHGHLISGIPLFLVIAP